MSDFHSIKVKTIQRQTKEAVAVSLDIPASLKQDFNYIPGQYLTFRIRVQGKYYNRSYSLCSSPALNEDLTVAVKEVKDGKVSGYFNNQLKEGEEVDVMLPLGNFKADITENDTQHYILFGGGSGITPLFSILKTALHKAPNTKVSLFYANYNSESVIFKNELLSFQKQFAGRFTLIHVFDKPQKAGGFLGFGKKVSEELPFVEGMMTEKMCLDLLKQHTDLNFSHTQFYMCGPGGLMDNVSKALSVLQIPAERVHREYFTEKSESNKQAANVGSADANFSGTASVEVIYDGKSHTIVVGEKQTILDVALDKDIDPPFACMVGACTTCKAKVLEGSVKMKDSEALTPKEIEAGYVLTCQALPTSGKIKISYDE